MNDWFECEDLTEDELHWLDIQESDDDWVSFVS
jgi:hypothetical protein